jgi:hypothetical protein
VFEMDLVPGVGIAVRSYPYAEVFYVLSGHTDFLRIDGQDQNKWLCCGPGPQTPARNPAYPASDCRQISPNRTRPAGI